MKKSTGSLQELDGIRAVHHCFLEEFRTVMDALEYCLHNQVGELIRVHGEVETQMKAKDAQQKEVNAL